MGHSITPEQVRHVARLARLTLSEQELARFGEQLGTILGYVDQISRPQISAEVSNVEPLAHALPISNVLRSDTTAPALTIDQVMQNAPKTDGQFFMVPKVINGDEDSAG